MSYTPSVIGTYSRSGSILAVFDYNNDGFMDVLAGRYTGGSVDGNPESLVLLRNNKNGTFADVSASALPTTATFQDPHVLVEDFNSDGIKDVAVFDAGTYGFVPSGGHGRSPILLLGQSDFTYRVSLTFKEAVLAAPRQGFELFFDGDLHVKSVTSGDIDNDGDKDVWVQSDGGDNILSHFMINDGAGNFGLDTTRVSYAVQHGASPSFWRYQAHALADLNNDGYLDLVFGQSRDNDVTHLSGNSFVLYNDKTGRFPDANKILLPQPGFYDNYTSVQSVVAADINGDALKDLIFVHTRNDQVTGRDASEAFAGRYVQIMINQKNGTFSDETATRMSSQTNEQLTVSQLTGGKNSNYTESLSVSDFNGDGFADIIFNRALSSVTQQNPYVYLNDGNGRFSPLPASALVGNNNFVGGPYSIDANKDGIMDFVESDPQPGSDGVYGTADDVSQILLWTGDRNYNNGAAVDVESGIYRFYNSLNGSHFYTASVAERTSLLMNFSALQYEGATFKYADASRGAVAPVFRFFNTATGTHFFTQSADERDAIIANLPSFNFEGEAYSGYTAQVAGSTPLYRFYNSVGGTHFYTANEAEKDAIIQTLAHYRFEGTAYWVDPV